MCFIKRLNGSWIRGWIHLLVDMSSVFLLLCLWTNTSSRVTSVLLIFQRLRETIYMRLSKGISRLYLQNHPQYAKFVDIKDCLVVRLSKCSYGLKQSGLEWNDELSHANITAIYHNPLALHVFLTKPLAGANFQRQVSSVPRQLSTHSIPYRIIPTILFIVIIYYTYEMHVCE